MNSDKSDDDSEFQTISKQIIDYYNRYAQNKDLLKYCLGSSVSYIPPIVKDDEFDNPEPTEDIAEEPAKVSPTSSVASNRKLEWDNGADIGYGNCTNLQKSISLPTVFTEENKKKTDSTQKKQLSRLPPTVGSHSTKASSSFSSPDIKQANIYSSSSLSEKSDLKALPSSSSSTTAPNRPSTSSSSLTYLKSKIGTPNAESTPKTVISYHYETPFVPKTKIVNLVPTKPIIVEYLHKKNTEEISKKIQTSIAEQGLSKCVQTGDSLERIFEKAVLPKQSIITIEYDSNTSSSNTRQTRSAASSFEYCPQNSQFKDDTDKKSSTESSTNTPILGEVISKKQSSTLIEDVNKTIELLQKLAKSKKYDIATKKRYIKKIVAKILENSYRDDTTISTSSESYLPQSNAEYFPKSSDSSDSWKTRKTLSEQIKEAHRGDGDYQNNLLNFAKKEHQHQLDWISDEIVHLTKLKDVLQKQKTTTVYMVQNGSKTPRNYVIETDLSPESETCSSQGNAFTLRNGQGTTNFDIFDGTKPRYVGDIEVISNENTTNIKVQAKRINNLMSAGSFGTFPKSRTEELRCWPCGMPVINKKSVDVPLEETAASLRRRINDILKNYRQLTQTRQYPKCQCHNCPNRKENNSTSSEDQDKKIKKESRDNGQNTCNCQDQESQTQSKTTLEKETQEHTKMTNSLAQTTKKSVENEGVQTDKYDYYNKECQTTLKSQSSQDSSQRELFFQVQQATSSGCQSPELPINVENSQIKNYNSNGDSQRDGIISTTDIDETSNSTTTPTENTTHSCICCKRKNLDTRHLYNLKKKLSDEKYSLCQPCYQQCKTQTYSPRLFMSPNHTCNCYTLVKTNTLNEIKKTIDDLNHQESCSCSTLTRGRKSLCQYCRQKLSKTSRNPNGIAYLLTFENVNAEQMPKKKHKRKENLEEIKIKVPTYKKSKDKENSNRRRKDEGRQKILREYLVENKPEFVEVADERRKVVNEAKAQREEIGDKNRLQFMENYEKSGPLRLFSDKEMKHITERNYRKLPEVQKKLVDCRRLQIKQANRVIVDTFNRKLRENVLKGKRSIPISVDVVKL